MRATWSSLPHQLRVAGLAMLAGWATVLSWRVLTADFAEVGVPLLFIGVVIAGGGALARWSRLPAAAIVAGQVVVGALLVLGTTTGSPFPTPDNVDAVRAALDAARESSRRDAAPVQAGGPSVPPLLLIGGTLVIVLVDAVACTLRRAPVAGLGQPLRVGCGAVVELYDGEGLEQRHGARLAGLRVPLRLAAVARGGDQADGVAEVGEVHRDGRGRRDGALEGAGRALAPMRGAAVVEEDGGAGLPGLLLAADHELADAR
jgi:hypothetical protein